MTNTWTGAYTSKTPAPGAGGQSPADAMRIQAEAIARKAGGAP